MNKIYIPKHIEDICVIVHNNYTLRAYKTAPNLNDNEEYTDIYFKSNYIEKNGIETILETKDCLSETMITNDFYYKYDFLSSLAIAFIIGIIIIMIPIKILFRLFKRFN